MSEDQNSSPSLSDRLISASADLNEVACCIDHDGNRHTDAAKRIRAVVREAAAVLDARDEQNPSQLVERLNECRDRIGKMCSESRPPNMTIPPRPDDDDEFIDAALVDAIAAIEQNRSLQSENERLEKANAGLFKALGEAEHAIDMWSGMSGGERGDALDEIETAMRLYGPSEASAPRDESADTNPTN